MSVKLQIKGKCGAKPCLAVLAALLTLISCRKGAEGGIVDGVCVVSFCTSGSMNVVPNSTKAEVPLSKGATVCVAAFQRAAGGATPAPQSDIWKASNTYAVQADGSLAASLTDDGGNPAAGSAPDMELHSGTYDFYAYSPALKTEADKYTVKGIPHYTDFMGALLPGRAVSRSTARVDLKFEHKCSKVRFNVVTAADMANSSLEADSTVLYKMAVSPARDFTLGGDLLPTLGGDADTCLLKRVEAADNNKSTSVWDIVLPKSGSSFDADFYLKVSGIRYLLQARDIPAMSFGKGTQYIFNAVVRKGSVSLVLNVAAWDAVPENVSAGEGDGAGSGSWEEGGGNAGGGSGANHGIEIGRWENVDWSGGMGGNPDPVTGAVEVGSWKPAQMLVDAGGSHVADVDSWVRKTLAAQAGGNHGGGVDGWDENGFESGMGVGIIRANCAMVKPGATANFDVADRLARASTAPGNSAINIEFTGNGLKPLVVWSDVANIVKTATYDNDKGLLAVVTDATKGVGNAVVGLFPEGVTNPSSGTCIWSWHVWVTDYQPDGTKEYGLTANQKADVDGGEVHTYGTKYLNTVKAVVPAKTSRVIMDRNLGATKAYYAPPAAVDITADQSFGMLYQWGRKDPLPHWDGKGSSDATATMIKIYGPTGAELAEGTQDNTTAAGYKKVSIVTAGSDAPATLSYSIKNPLTFIYNSGGKYDWYTANGTQNDGLWGDGGVKSVYDPCPTGWRIAPNGTWTDFGMNPYAAPFWYYINGSPQAASGDPVFVQSGRNGRLYEAGSVKAWYPASGFRGNGEGMLWGVGNQGFGWSSSVDGANCSFDLIFNSTYLDPSHADGRAAGFLVRCIQE